MYNVELPVGQPTASGMLYLIVGANHPMTASRSYIGLPSSNVIIITLSVRYMIVSTTEVPYHFMTITIYLRLQPDLILTIRPVTSTINASCYSFFVHSPFLWNSILYSILQLQKSPVCFVRPCVVTFFWFLQMYIIINLFLSFSLLCCNVILLL